MKTAITRCLCRRSRTASYFVASIKVMVWSAILPGFLVYLLFASGVALLIGSQCQQGVSQAT